MKKMVLALLATLLVGAAVFAQKLTVSVMDLNVSEGLTQPQVQMLTDCLLNEFVALGTFKVVERSKRDEILKEQGFQQSGACDQGACLVEAGQLLGVQKMVGGTIGKLGTMYSLQLRMIDVKTGEIDKAFPKSYSGDISLLLEGMREAACYFCGIRYQAAQAVKTAADTGLTFLQINAQGYNEYRNQKDGSTLFEVPASEFIMGSNDGGDNEKPIHTVYLDKYYIGKYEVTVGQYKKFCNATGRTIPEQPDWNQGDNYPVVNVIWNDAKAYCDWAGLRLPTEAEWEKAARGTDGRSYPWGNSWDGNKCNHGSGSISSPDTDASTDASDGYENTSSVGSFSSGVSPYGCYDMAGNVWEWCNDWYGGNYYGSSPSSNPAGPSSGTHRVLRGGSWCWYTYFCRSAARCCIAPDFRLYDFGLGFRSAK